MEKTSTLINGIYTNTNEYIRLQSKSVELEVYERVTDIISSGIKAGFILVSILFSLLYVNFGLAYWLGEKLQSQALGFVCIGGFYAVALGIYLLLKDKIAKNALKNSILLKISKTRNDYDTLIKEQVIIHNQSHQAEQILKANFEELKDNIDTLKEDYRKIKSHFVNENKDSNNTVGPKIPRIAITSIVDFLIQKVVFKNAGLIKQTILPLITNTVLTSKIFKEDTKTSFVENIKLKLSKFF